MFKMIAKVLKSVREYKIFAIITPLFMIGEAAVECALPFIMTLFVDSIKDVVLTIGVVFTIILWVKAYTHEFIVYFLGGS